MQEGIFKDIFQLERGIFYTIGELFLRPGIAMRGYLAGKRKRFFNSIALLLLIGSMYFILENVVEPGYYELSMFSDGIEGKVISDFDAFARKYQKLFILLGVPASAVASFLFFRMALLNFSEHIVINAYRTSAELIISMPVLLLALCLRNEVFLSMIIVSIGIVILGYGFYFFYRFFKPYVDKKSSLIWRTLGAVILVQVVNMAFIYLVATLFRVMGFI